LKAGNTPLRFKTRLLVIYAILCLIVAGSVAVLYYYYNKKLYMETEEKLLQTSSEHIANEFNLIIENMEFATTYVVGESDFLDSLNLLIRNQKSQNCPIYYKQEALLNIKKVLGRDFLTKNFYNVRLFNEDGLMIAYDSVLDSMMDYEQTVKEISWFAQVRSSEESVVLIKDHVDDWGENGTHVISLIREILGYGVYIEVQYAVEHLEERLNLPEEVQGILIVDKNKNVLYQSENFPKEIPSNVPMAVSASGNNGTTMFLIGKLEKQQSALKEIRNTAFLIAGFIIAILLVYINISAEILVKPVKKLQKIMEITEFEKMNERVEFSSNIRELDDLAHSYEMLLKRLQKSMVQNKKTEQLYLETQLESLQSKVSPHFMANILNVLSCRGLELGDREICQISTSMGSLLRYSTDNRNPDVSVEEEIKYLKDYCYLMKARYMEKLIYEIQIPEEIKKERIPKLSLQQLVENAIKHGFRNQSGKMEIQVSGVKTADGWYLTVQDNGEGFSSQCISEIMKNVEEKKRQLKMQEQNLELTIGGMGLVNLYLRMYFLYGEGMMFEIKEHVQKKKVNTEVLIGVKSADSGKESEDVYDCCSR